MAKLAFDGGNLSFISPDCFWPLATSLDNLERVLHAWRILVVPCAQVSLEIQPSCRMALFAAVFNQVIDLLGVAVVTKVDSCNGRSTKSGVLPFQKRSR